MIYITFLWINLKVLKQDFKETKKLVNVDDDETWRGTWRMRHTSMSFEFKHHLHVELSFIASCLIYR